MKLFAKMSVCILLFVVSLFGCSTNQYVCRIITDSDDWIVTDSTLTEPFISDNKRNQLIEEAVHTYLKNSPSFTYEIMSEDLVFYEKKDTLVYWLSVVDTQGFSYAVGVIIQHR